MIMIEMKEKRIYECIMDAAEAIMESQKRRPENYIILSSEQIKRLESGESKFEFGICTAPYSTAPIITRDGIELSIYNDDLENCRGWHSKDNLMKQKND